jgi:Rrf2 family protein
LELTRRGDYAVRAALCLADAHGRSVSGHRIAAETAIPAAFLPQVMGDLVRAGIVHSRPGPHGGYLLATGPSTISLLAVIEAVEGNARRRTCVLRGTACGIDDPCRVHHAFFAAQEQMLQSLAGVSLMELSRSSHSRRRSEPYDRPPTEEAG